MNCIPWQTLRRLAVLPVLFFFVFPAYAAGSVLRVACDDDNTGAEVFTNGAFKGECPLDIQVNAGTLTLRVSKKIDANYERIFEQELRMGDGVAKKVEVILPAPRLNPQAQQREDQRLAVDRAEKAKLEAEIQARMAEQARMRTQRLDQALTAFRAQGAEVGNGKPFKDCSDCPSMVLIGDSGKTPVAMGQYEVTRGQFAKFVRETNRMIPGGCDIWVGGWFTDLNKMWQHKIQNSWKNPNFPQTDDHPVVCVSVKDAEAYTEWLSKKTGTRYTLPTYAWWSVAAGGQYGKPVPAPFGKENSNACKYGNIYDASSDKSISTGMGKLFPCDDGFVYTAPVGQSIPSPTGVFDMFGNVSEILSDIDESTLAYIEKYVPASAKAWRDSAPRLLRGWSWAKASDGPEESTYLFERSTIGEVRSRVQTVGFRVMRYLVPDQ